MFNSIELEKFRGFQRYQIGNLARVNLLVGKNNCGKTSILESVYLLAASGHPRVIGDLAWKRDEVVFAREIRAEESRRPFPTVLHYFYDRKYEPGTSFNITSEGGARRLTVEILPLSAMDNYPIVDMVPSFPPPILALKVEADFNPEHPFSATCPISEEGAFSVERALRFARLGGNRIEEVLPIQFVDTESLDFRAMSELWDLVITSAQESFVVQALRILEPKLSSIFFLSRGGAYAHNKSGVLLAFEGVQRRFPLASYGDGMRRLLALSLAIVRARGGILLIDEIDTGLHYSIMGDIWYFVVEAAKRFEVQVFATTHSSDCVRGLAWLCDNYPDLGAEVSLQKIEPRLAESVAHDAERILIAADLGIEVR